MMMKSKIKSFHVSSTQFSFKSWEIPQFSWFRFHVQLVVYFLTIRKTFFMSAECSSILGGIRNKVRKKQRKKLTLITMSLWLLQQVEEVEERSLKSLEKKNSKFSFSSCYSTFENSFQRFARWLSDKRNVWTRQLIFDLKIFQSFNLNVSRCEVELVSEDWIIHHGSRWRDDKDDNNNNKRKRYRK